ncbi:Choline/ethanolamine kinase [Lasiodiplodia theobromae]|uniref:Choline/ethanolamine kinase n=1 Tax=Lasiodiplodia theobromae TaxID=45133 RepID=UPI0015C383BA|nr:Choline/ethanolamine kinase [Lasiodiplodia theobromae]KAF4535567.1 Choline/ethanolamine kinase [Lasiodiplodia theobromae]KAF9638854.1 Choline/ethanolamine kinase [Lasiodiplodia theobromae]
MSSEPAKQANDSALKPPADSSGNGGISPAVAPRSPAPKVVTIADPEISPILEPAHSKDVDDDGTLTLERTPSKQQHRIKIGKRLSGRPLSDRNASSGQSLAESALSDILAEDSAHSSHRGHGHHAQQLMAQVSAWLKQEKARRAARKASKRAPPPESSESGIPEKSLSESADVQTDGAAENEVRRPSDASEGSVALDALEHILEKGISAISHEGRKMPHRIGRKLRRQSTAGSSDTEYQDGDVLVPSCDVVLDNTRTLAYSGGGIDEDDEDDQLTPGTRKVKEKQAWATFKYEIVRLAHTLRLKGWRRVPMDRSSDIEVERLSGALTNAVYVVSPPKDLPPRQGEEGDIHPRPRNPPPKLLLRVYGPQVEHLIDRESELQILRRLARKKIGPRLLGTFSNGRFEEFFHARTLTPRDLRNPDTSVQIAKRMRELHEGIDLLPQEREDGPFIWKNWDKWVDRCEYISKWLDAEVSKLQAGSKQSEDIGSLAELGFVCGVPWDMFRQTVDKYRNWLNEQYGGTKELNERLVFAHNDTQYGNILRLIPPGDSPLLLPANEHKQLVVIDFEYANANTPGLEFANHFTEWCYNYHDEKAPHAVNTNAYPTPAEQHRFIRSYITHRPFQPSHSSDSSTTPSNARPPTLTHSSSISAFMLDSRAPPQQLQEQEEREEAEIEKEVKRLMGETRLWRLANSAQWVAWGIVQAKLPGLPDFDSETKKNTAVNGAIPEEEQDYMNPQSDQGVGVTDPPSEDLQDKKAEEGADLGDAGSSSGTAEEEEFDYLGYANDRAMFFWGDAVRLGIVKDDELPEELRQRLKVVDY